MTAFSPAISDENLANQVYAILSSEQHRKDSEFDVKDVQYIHAEVFQFTILLCVSNAYICNLRSNIDISSFGFFTLLEVFVSYDHLSN